MLSNVVNFFRGNFHSEGYRHYKTYEARKAYADSLLKVADRLFIAALLPLVSLVYFQSEMFYAQLFFAIIGFCGGVYMRHQGLLIIDYINRDKSKR